GRFGRGGASDGRVVMVVDGKRGGGRGQRFGAVHADDAPRGRAHDAVGSEPEGLLQTGHGVARAVFGGFARDFFGRFARGARRRGGGCDGLGGAARRGRFEDRRLEAGGEGLA